MENLEASDELERAEWDARDWIFARSVDQAVIESDTTCAWANNYSLKSDILNLGKRVSATYRLHYELLKEPNELIHRAIKYFWIVLRSNELLRAMDLTAARYSYVEGRKYAEKVEASYAGNKEANEWAFWKDMVENKYVVQSNSEYDAHMMKAQEFFALPLYTPLLDAAGFPCEEDSDELLTALALKWFCNADELMVRGNVSEALDEVCEAFNALAAVDYHEGWNFGLNSVWDDQSKNASRWAKIRHIPTNEKRRQVIEHWRAHIPPGMSNEKAGEWLHDSFPELSVRKLSEYVARAKKEVKEIPPAGKA